MNRECKFIVVHCSDTPSDMDIGAAEIRTWHTLPPPRGNGWSDIGYHFVIRRDGKLELGRSLDQDHLIEPGEVGAHVAGYNSVSIGICLVGGARRVAGGGLAPQDNFTPRQFEVLANELRTLQSQFPRARIVGHHTLNPGKACPSFNVDAYLAQRGIEQSP